jgi:hypothetical protein
LLVTLEILRIDNFILLLKMSRSLLRKLFFCLFIASLAVGSCNAQIFHRNPEKQLFSGASSKRKKVKVKEPRKVLKAKKKQEANDRRLKNEYDKSVKQSQQRTIDIQTPEVQERMKQNRKDYTARDKDKKKKLKEATKKAGKKYD